jgi:hypothetical protein
MFRYFSDGCILTSHFQQYKDGDYLLVCYKDICLCVSKYDAPTHWYVAYGRTEEVLYTTRS